MSRSSRSLKTGVILGALVLVQALVVQAARAELIFWTPNRSEADLSVYVTDMRTGTNCVVFVTQSRTEARQHSAFWFTTPSRTEATLKIFRSPTRTDADRVVFFTPNRTEARCDLR